MDTPVSLLERLQRPAEQEAWPRFVELYTPLLYDWARQAGAQPADAADLVQEVFTLLVRKLPEFTYDRRKSFRSWLRAVALNKWRELRRRQNGSARQPRDAELANLAVPDSLESFWDAEYRDRLVGRALELMRT